MKVDKSLVLCALLAVACGCGTEEPDRDQHTTDVLAETDADEEATDGTTEPDVDQEPASFDPKPDANQGAAGVDAGPDENEETTGDEAEPPKDFTNSIGMKLKLIPAGEFIMGSPVDEEAHLGDETQHRVRITEPYYLGVHEVTQSEYERVMGENPSHFKGSTLPVELVSWEDAEEFCRKLTVREGREYRLPTEAEWEYACRVGTTTPFHFGSVLNGTQANCTGTYPYGTRTKGPCLDCTTTVGSYTANEWGLYDMHGNVREWCSDWWAFDYYESSPVDNPTGPSTGPPSGSSRVMRGGGWVDLPKFCRSAFRSSSKPGRRFHYVGFRVALGPAGRQGTGTLE